MNERSIFLEALEKDPSHRSAYLDEVCGQDAELRKRVEELLRSHEEAGSFLEKSPPGVLPETAAQPDVSNAGPTPHSPASGFVPPEPEQLAKLFPQLEILGLLGKGGMGAVYKACQPGLDRLVALKILPREVSHEPAFAERFTREARALAKLSHPNIVAIYDFGQTNDTGEPGVSTPGAPLYYFLMEYVDGANLRQLIDSHKLEPKEALAIVPQICEALQFAHDEGIVHRDIKPENILMDKKGRVKIADFGLAKILASGGREPPDYTLTGAHQVMGTPHYMAPEQMKASAAVDHRADIYSLGVVFYEMLTGELPIGRFEPPSKRVQVDVRLDEVVIRALEQDPEKRYQKVSEVKTEVESIRDSGQRIVQAGVTPAHSPSSQGGWPLDWAASAVAKEVRWPAVALIVLGALNSAPSLLVLSAFFSRLSGGRRLALGIYEIVALSGMLAGMFMILGGLLMGKLRSYGLSVVAAVLAMIPAGWLWFFTLPTGIWSLLVLRDPRVRAAFGHRATEENDKPRKLAAGDFSRPQSSRAEPVPPAGGPQTRPQRSSAPKRHSTSQIIIGLRWILVCLNIGVLALGVALAPRRDNFSYGYTNLFEKLIGYLWNSRDLEPALWITLASLILSLGIYVFLVQYLRRVAGDESTKELVSDVSIAQEDRSGWICAVLATLLLVAGLFVALLALIGGMVGPREILAFLAVETFAAIFGLFGRRYPLGRASASAALVLVLLVAGAPVVLYQIHGSNRIPSPEPPIAALPSLRTILRDPALGFIRQEDSEPDTLRYQVTGPVDCKAVFWVEYYLDGKPKNLEKFNHTVWRIPALGKGFSGHVQLRLQEGYKLSPDARGKVRWDWKVETEASQATSGDWMEDPFQTVHGWGFDPGPSQKQEWAVRPGEDTLLFIKAGGDKTYRIVTGDIPATVKGSEVVFLLKTCFEPLSKEEFSESPSTVHLSLPYRQLQPADAKSKGSSSSGLKSVIPTSAARNLAQNPGAEEALGPNSDQVALWTAEATTLPGKEPPARVFRDTAEKVSGQASFAVHKAESLFPGADTGFFQTIPKLATGKTLRVSGWIKTAEVENAAFIVLRLLPAEGNPIPLAYAATEQIKGTNAWKHYEARIKVPQESRGILCLVQWGRGKAWFDDVEVVEE